mgnify:FL=1
MDIAKFEHLLTLPLEIKKIREYGSWRGIYAEPALFFDNKDEYIPISELNEAFDDLTSGKEFYGYKGGEYSFECADEIHFEYDYSQCSDLSILELLSPDSVEYLRKNNIEIR